MLKIKLLLGLLVIALCMNAQTQRVVSLPPCVITFFITATGQQPSATGFDNRQLGCTNWNLTYSSTGFTVVSLQVESAPSSSNVAPGTPGTYVAFAGTVNSGINPNTSITQAASTFSGYFPWIRVNAITLTGSGVVVGSLIGTPSISANGGAAACVTPTTCQVVGAAANGAAISGNPVLVGFFDGTNVQVPIVCTLKQIFNIAAAGNTQIIPASGSTTIRICHIDMSTTATEDVKLTTGTGANCVTGTADLTGLLKSVQSFDLNYTPFSPLVGVASGAICINTSATTVLGGTVIYAQF